MKIPYHVDLYKRLRRGELTRGADSSKGFAFDLNFSVPTIVTAIHAGHRVRTELRPLLCMSEEERLFEEDPATDILIRGNHATIWGLDSRSEYDLNRPPELALPLTPDMFWGKQVYHTVPTAGMNRQSLQKYDAFYLLIGSCIKVMLERYGVCLVYDIHSYNISRQIRKGVTSPPLFNIGTELLNRLKWQTAIDDWRRQLEKIQIPGIETTVAENKVFSGKGELCRRLSAWDPNILVLPTEISKVYINEHSGEIKTKVVSRLQRGLQHAISEHSRQFLERFDLRK
ncbi:MAG: N-formylglutamate amidohydrolase [Desulfobacterales bacterium]|jgi:hypothetical protein